MEQILQAAAAKLDIPGAVVVAGNASGTVSYRLAVGVSSLKEGESKQGMMKRGSPLELNSTFWLASLSKLMTAVAALQCVERGQFTLDEDVTRLLPEFVGIEILQGFDRDGKPILTKAKKKITLRLLLTNTSGLAYDVYNRRLQQWRKSRGEVAHMTKNSLQWRYSTPLLFEPGESWEYGAGYDWAGQMVERANRMSLGEYLQTHVWRPLGLRNMSFHLDHRPEMLARLPHMSERQGGTNNFATALRPEMQVKHTDNGIWTATGVQGDSGGAGCYGNVLEFQKILQSLVSTDETLLGRDMKEELFRPQLGAQSQRRFEALLAIKEWRDIMGVNAGIKMGHAFGGVVTMEDTPGKRSMGSMSWQGLPNVYWWADRTAGLCGIFATQIVPTGDPKALELFGLFEESMYKQLEKDVEGGNERPKL